ncbi:MAG TPA: hypothetical protein VG709_04140, partial [Actinomycetota bacterium]|nr:hypothetical protein [Actinomycetota bacterium]
NQPFGGCADETAPYRAMCPTRSADMCIHCGLATPNGLGDVCVACAVAVRSEVRRGLDAIEKYLDGWSELDRWRSDQE